MTNDIETMFIPVMTEMKKVFVSDQSIASMYDSDNHLTFQRDTHRNGYMVALHSERTGSVIDVQPERVVYHD